MPRLARLFVPGCPLHIIQRGHNKQDVFLDEADRARFMEWMWESADTHAIAVHAWVLMSNHVHLALSAPTSLALGKFGQFISQRYSQYFNHRYHRMGTLWQGRFKSSPVLSEQYLLRLYRYIELNPVRARLVAEPGDYRWSSYLHHVGVQPDTKVSDHALYWQLGNTPFDRQARYREFCAEGVSESERSQLYSAVLSGYGLQSEADAHKLVESNREVRPAPRGRPGKQSLHGMGG
jgi:putative transposase